MDNILFFTDLYAGTRVPMLRGAKEFAAARNWQVQVIELARVTLSIPKALSIWNPPGCIIESSAHLFTSRRLFASRRLFGRLPMVFIEPGDGILGENPQLTISNDNAKIADLALSALLKTDAVHFAFVGWTAETHWNVQRLDAFRRRLDALGKPCSQFLYPWTMGNASGLRRQLLPFLAGLPRPCAVFAANDDIAAEALAVCQTAGIHVPDEIAVIGVDDNESVCETCSPSLSSVCPDFHKTGYLAMKMLDFAIRGEIAKPHHLRIRPVGCTLRQSTRKLNRRNSGIAAALEFIRKEACRGIKAADVVRLLNLSERVAESRFKAATGRRITEEIAEVRLAKATSLLRQPNQSISAIANLCGWQSDAYLKRIFKARFGVSMREWRKNNLYASAKRQPRN